MTELNSTGPQNLKNKVLTVEILVVDFIEEYKELQLLSEDEQKSSIVELLKDRYQGAEERQEIQVEDGKAIIKWYYNKTIPGADSYNQEALKFIRQKNYEKAIQCWENAIQINPTDPDYYYNLGLALLGNKNTEKGIDSCLEALRICPLYYRANFVLGSLYSKMRKYEKAEEFMRSGLLLNRNNVQSLVNLGALYSILRKFDEAIKCFERAIKISSKEIKAYLGIGKIYQIKKDYDNAIRNYKVVTKLDPDGELGKIGRNLIASLNITETPEEKPTPDVEPEEETESGDAPEYVNTLYAEGYQYFIEGNYDKAIIAYKEFLKYNKSDADVWSSLASCQARIGNIDESIKSIEKALAIESENKAMFYKQAAIIYDTVDKYRECEQAARSAFEFGKQDSIVLTLIGKSLIYQNKLNEGLNFLEDAVKLNANNLTARYNLGIALQKLGQNDKAMENFEEIIWSKYKSPLKNKAREAIQGLTAG